MRLSFCIFLLVSAAIAARAQEPVDSIKLKEVNVSSVRNTYANKTTLNSSTLPVNVMQSHGSFNISDGLTLLPGISQMTTGVAISKPVIRGLYGNRIQTVFSGLRFDNQQWQDEHGLGITDIGVDRVEVIKGPASLLYGSEAVGGVINIIEETDADEGRISGDLNTRFLSNTRGNATDIGFKGNSGKRNWKVRGGYESDADYQDGNGNRILNSRFGGYYFKAGYGFKKNNWISRNNYSASLNNFGFIMSDSKTDKVLDNRFSRTMDGPHHTVFLNLVSSQNVIQLKNAILKLNIGAQSNIRMEDEGGGEISLNMHLSSFVYNLQWIKMLTERTELIVSNQSLLQNNSNFGKRILVPDADIAETGLSVFLNQKIKILTLEGGIGGNYRYIKTMETGNFNTPDKEIKPFTRSLPAANAMLGITINPVKTWNVKLCGSTGFRSGNMAELSSNGLHEGIYQYEIGNPHLKAEQNYNAEIAVNYSGKYIQCTATVFNNHFNNYIYLTPTDERFYGIQVLRYFQNDANLHGGEATASLHFKGLEANSSFATVNGILNDTTRLPFMPANKIHSEFKYTFNIKNLAKGFYVLLSNDYVFEQKHPATHETKTASYTLYNAGIGSSIAFRKEVITFSFICNNLLNAYYYDHLSRFKNYGFHNIGRNVVLNIHIPFNLK